MDKEEIDLEEQKFLSHDSSDPSSVKIVDPSERKVAFNGLSKDEIMRYGSDPFWVKIRWLLLLLFWVVWFGMLAFAVLNVVYSPKCPFRPRQTWWEKEVIYQLDVDTFKDSNGDGRGDLNGLIQKLAYFDKLGVKVLNLRDNLLSADDAQKVDKTFGTNEDLKHLKKHIDDNDMHLIIDIPMSYLEQKDTEIIRYWLRDVADGIRITQIDKSSLSAEDKAKKLTEWIELGKKIYGETFRPKLVAFYPIDENVSKQLVPPPGWSISSNLLDIKPIDIKSKDEFLKKIDFDQQAQSFMLGHYDSPRIADSIVDSNDRRMLHILAMLLKGTPVLLYGDEIEFDKEDKLMKWDTSNFCGFTTSNVTASNVTCEHNVRLSLAHGSTDSLVRLYGKLIKLRKEPSFSWGKLKTPNSDSDKHNVISFVREADGFEGYLIVANLDSNIHLVDYKLRHDLPDKAEVVHYFSQSNSQNDDFKQGASLDVDNISLPGRDLLILKFKRE